MQFFLLVNLALVIVVTYGHKAVLMGRSAGLVFSWLLVATGILALTVHVSFLLQGKEAFWNPVSSGLLLATFLLSLAQATVMLRSPAQR